MSKKDSFAKLTEGIEKLNEEQVEKSDIAATENKVEFVEVPPAVKGVNVVQPEGDTPAKEEEEPKAEEADEKKSEEDEAKEKEEAAKAEAEAAEKDKEPEEDVKKSEEAPESKEEPKADEAKKEEPKLEPQDAVKEEVKAAENTEEKKEEVEKSADPGISEAALIGAFEAIHKSYGMLLTEVQSLRAEIRESVSKSVKAEDVKTDEVKEPEAEKVEEPEQVEKSVEEPEENIEGKSVDYISKSNGVPEIENPEAGAEEQPAKEEEFNPQDHVDAVTNYFIEKASTFSNGERQMYRSAVQRVKRGEPTEADVNLFREVIKPNS